MGVKYSQIDFPGTEMLSLARISKYVINTSVKHQQLRGGQPGLKGLTKLDSYCSDKLIFMLSDKIVVSNKNIYSV